MHYLWLSLTSLLIISGCSKTPAALTHHIRCQENIYAMKSGECIDMLQLLDRLEPYRVIFLGDHHTSEASHRFVADIINGLGKKGYRVHLANEWFSPEDNPLLAAYAAKEIDDGNFTERIEWKKRAGYSFDLYAPVYHAVRQNSGNLYGINLGKPFRKRISDQNITGMNQEELTFYNQLDLNVSAHRQMLSPFFSHCHGKKKGESDAACEIRMNRVQVAWDTMMAKESAALSERVLNNPDEKLLVFVGSMHLAYNLGVNMRYGRYSNLPSVTVLPETLPTEEVIHGLADIIYFYAPETPTKQGG